MERLGMTMDRVVVNIDEYGNTTAGTIPLAMHTALERGLLKKGDLVLLASMGAEFQRRRNVAPVGRTNSSLLSVASNPSLRIRRFESVDFNPSLLLAP